jgi:archaellum component FlaG (FlaF/FlaG flagellin family)
MGFQIENGAEGARYGLEIDSNNRAQTFSITEPEDKGVNKNGGVYSTYFSVTPAGANDYFFYLKNTGTVDLYVTDIRISCTVASTIYYKAVTGTPSYASSSTQTTTNRNLGSSKTLTATIRDDTDITGLTDAGVIFFEECASTDTRYKLSTTSNIIIPQGSAIAFQKVAATGVVECVVSIVEGSLG